MPDPHDTLSILSQVVIALAGFSGIVIAVERRSAGSLTRLEARRLFNLYAFSGLVLFMSLLCISLLHVDGLPERSLWRGASAVLVVTGVPWMIYDTLRIRRLDPEERAMVKRAVVYPFNVMAVLAVLLPLYNIFVLGEAWPFFVALILQLAFTFQQFILLIWSGFRNA